MVKLKKLLKKSEDMEENDISVDETNQLAMPPHSMEAEQSVLGGLML